MGKIMQKILEINSDINKYNIDVIHFNKQRKIELLLRQGLSYEAALIEMENMSDKDTRLKNGKWLHETLNILMNKEGEENDT